MKGHIITFPLWLWTSYFNSWSLGFLVCRQEFGRCYCTCSSPYVSPKAFLPKDSVSLHLGAFFSHGFMLGRSPAQTWSAWESVLLEITLNQLQTGTCGSVPHLPQWSCGVNTAVFCVLNDMPRRSEPQLSTAATCSWMHPILLSLTSAFPTSTPGIASQIIYLHTIPCFVVWFWGNST